MSYDWKRYCVCSTSFSTYNIPWAPYPTHANQFLHFIRGMHQGGRIQTARRNIAWLQSRWCQPPTPHMAFGLTLSEPGVVGRGVHLLNHFAVNYMPHRLNSDQEARAPLMATTSVLFLWSPHKKPIAGNQMISYRSSRHSEDISVNQYVWNNEAILQDNKECNQQFPRYYNL